MSRLSLLKGFCWLFVLIHVSCRAAEAVTLTDPLPSAVTGACARGLQPNHITVQVNHRCTCNTVGYIPRCFNTVKQARTSHCAADVAGLVESVLGGAAVNQTLEGLARSLASLYRAALAQPALALGAVPSPIPGAVTSLWSLLGNALREAAKPPPIVPPALSTMC